MNDQELREVFDYHGKERLVDGKNGAIGKNKDLPVHVKSFYPPGELARKAKLLGVRYFLKIFIFLSFSQLLSSWMLKSLLSLSHFESNRRFRVSLCVCVCLSFCLSVSLSVLVQK